jgi:AraC-like DNA-binding protein
MLLAMQLMQNSSMQIKNISTAIGYDSSSKFTVFFKKRFGILPSEIRNK